MTFLEHLHELRRRLIYCAWGFVIAFAAVYSFKEQIFLYLMRPLCSSFDNRECHLITLGLAEAFMVYLKTALVAGFFLSLPWMFFQLWQFISPGLHSKEKRYVLPFVVSASVMFAGGAIFGYFVIFPFAFDFFLNLAGPEILPMPSMDAYFGFAFALLFAFGFLFEIPVLVVLFNIIGLIEAKTLWRTWRYAIVVIFALSAILTPADPFTMLALGIPLSILYMISLFIVSALEAKRKRPVTD